ncbi:MAG TPA: aminotransferase class I/II-fold pyridoxal phosphate-dependent enzyme [Thermoanaerobaculia bacterium]
MEERRATGLPVYDFGLGETKGALPEDLRAAGERAYREQRTMYGDPAGLLELRRRVLEWLHLEGRYGPEDVVVTSGAKQSLFNIFLALCNPADAVLFDAAPWVSYQPLAVAAYAVPIMVVPRASGSRLKVTAEDLRRNLLLRPHVKLFLLNNPCNPTAQLYDAREVEELLSVCVEHRVYFVLDRLYWRLVFDGVAYAEPRVDEETKPWLIQVDGLSKNFRRAGGLRIGWSVAPRDVARAMTNLQSHYTSGPSTPAQHVALAAVTRAYDAELLNDLEEKRDRVAAWAGRLPGVDVWPSPATFYSFWDVTGVFGKRAPDGRTIACSEDLAVYLVERAGVVAAAGAAFMQEGYLRVSFAVPADELEAGLAAAAEALGALR